MRVFTRIFIIQLKLREAERKSETVTHWLSQTQSQGGNFCEMLVKRKRIKKWAVGQNLHGGNLAQITQRGQRQRESQQSERQRVTLSHCAFVKPLCQATATEQQHKTSQSSFQFHGPAQFSRSLHRSTGGKRWKRSHWLWATTAYLHISSTWERFRSCFFCNLTCSHLKAGCQPPTFGVRQLNSFSLLPSFKLKTPFKRICNQKAFFRIQLFQILAKYLFKAR